MTVLPPEVAGPNPGQPGHFAHTDWLTASVKALDVEAMDNRLPPATIVMFYGLTPPAGWLMCDGSPIPGSATDLIAIVGPNTPDLRSRVPVGAHSGLGLGTGDSESVSARSMTHNHGGNTGTVPHTGATTAAGGSNQNKVSTLNGTVSGTHAHTIPNETIPHLALGFIIKT